MRILFALFLFALLASITGENTLHSVDNTKIEFNKTYDGSLENNMVQSYSFTRAPGQTVRINTNLKNDPSDLPYPLLFSVEQRFSILSWTLPMNLSKFVGYSYTSVSRTLCSDYAYEPANITIWALTSSPITINYTLQVIAVSGFYLTPNDCCSHTMVNISHGSPQYFSVSFPHNASSDVMRVSLNSVNSSCIIASLQPAECPVDDLLSTVDYRGVYLTFNQTADMIIDRSTTGSEEYYLVLVSAPDSKCKSGSYSGTNQISFLTKTVDIKVTLALASWDYWRPVVILLALLFLPFFVLVPLFLFETFVICKSTLLERHWPLIFYTPKLSNIIVYDQLIPSQITPLLSNQNAADNPEPNILPGVEVLEYNEPVAKNLNSYFDSIPPNLTNSLPAGVVGMSKKEMKLNYNQKNFYLHDLSRKHDIYLWKKFFLYLTSVITVTMFYALPALQVALFRVIMYNSGDNDLCYFNFKCARTLDGAVSFNNIWSNIAYLVLGVMFILLTGIKHYLRRQMLRSSEKDIIQEYRERGVTPYFGIYYALGFALISEGLMSSIYHTCPSGINFQFDSTFMFIISALCILKLYQNRHPDVSVGAASTFMLLGTLIILTAFGLLANRQDFFIIRTTYALIVIGITSFICVHIYFFSHPTLLFSAIFETIKARKLDALKSSLKNVCYPPSNKPRILHIILLCIVNGACLAGLFIYQIDAASALLMFMISNLVLYTLYYWGMKIIFCEIKNRPFVALFSLFLAVFSAVLFLTALYFFFSTVTNWQLSPSSSRLMNQECIFLGFYDTHDIWHILSAFGLFFNFLSITMIDDNLSDISKKDIRVF